MRRGFTLVEMLVATALVMLMMLLFAEVFGAAVGTMTAQRGIANNDQKARSFTTILRHDLAARTYRAATSRGATGAAYFEPDANANGVFDLATEDLNGNGVQDTILISARGIVPLAPGDVVEALQEGYLYYSENDVDDDSDDVLQFTARISPTAAEAAPAPYYGRARKLEEPNYNPNPNQPDRDDGIESSSPIGAATSRAAEIAYYVRGRNLYRRVMLLRDPLPNSPPFSTQPTAGTDGTAGPFTYPDSSGGGGPPYFDQPYVFTGTSFYNDWDFSGTRLWTDSNGNSTVEVEPTDTYQFHFHGVDSLDNSIPGASNIPLGFPWNRFGFYSRFGVNRSVEHLFDTAGNQIAFIGRFTHEETSHSQFDWPGIEQGPGLNMMMRNDLVLSPLGTVAVDANTSGSYDAGDVLLQGSRAGEDILLTNVEAFDIEVWDPGFQEDPNANGVPGFQPGDPDDDPNGNGVQDFGAWVDIGNSYPIGLYRAANRANTAFGPGGPTLTGMNHVYDTWHPEAGIDTNGDGAVDSTEFLEPPYRLLQQDPGGVYALPPWPRSVTLGEVVFPYFNASPGPQNLGLGFVAVRTTTGAASGNTDATEPLVWPTNPGDELTDNEIVWRCFDNRIGLEQIRITVRYRDISTGQARQVTLVHSLVD